MFFQEIMAYRPTLMRALVGILGEVEAKSVLRRLWNQQDARGIREKLKELVPEYMPQETECVL
jgi:hypothetical protein